MQSEMHLMSLLILMNLAALINGSNCTCIIAAACRITVGYLLANKQHVLPINYPDTNFKPATTVM
jgi:hypothetical protein